MASTENDMPDMDLSAQTLPHTDRNITKEQFIDGEESYKGDRPRVLYDTEEPVQPYTTKSQPLQRNDGIVAAICEWTIKHQIGSQ